jgi:hypothetical protein
MAFMSFKISAWAPVAKADALLSWSGLREQFFINPFRELFNLSISINNHYSNSRILKNFCLR